MTAKPKPQRTRELTLIHVGRQELGMSDDAYRDMLWTLCRVRSAKDLDESGRNKVLSHMKARGFKPRKTGFKKRNPIKNRPKKLHDPLEKMQALLVVLNAGWEYADGIAKRMYQIDSVAFLNEEQATAVIAALTIKAQKEMKAALDLTLSGTELTWKDLNRIAVELGYNVKRLESNVKAMCDVWEHIHQRRFGNNPQRWEDIHPRKRHE